MKMFTRNQVSLLATVVIVACGRPEVRGASLYLSAVAETSGAAADAMAPRPGKPITYAAIDGGYISAGDPVGGEKPASASMVDSALARALAGRGYQPAPAGEMPSLLIVYNWGEIRHDSYQVRPTDHLRGNERARLLLVTCAADEKRIESDLVNDRYSVVRMGAITRTEADRESLQLAREEMDFIVISAYDPAALRRHDSRFAWQVRLTTRAVGNTMSDALATLIDSGAQFFGRNEPARKDLKVKVVPVSSDRVESPVGGLNQALEGIDPAFVQRIVQDEHAMWSGTFPTD